MNRYITLAIFTLLVVVGMKAQKRISCEFNNVSLSDALRQLGDVQTGYTIYFLYNELEDFRITTTIKNKRLPEAILQMVGFYPIRVTTSTDGDGKKILVECIQKDRTKLIGRLVGPDNQPIRYANITLFPPSDTTYVGGGVSNETGDFVIPCSITQARVRISCIGFKTIERMMPIDNVGTIRMQMENYNLGNVSVNGRMSVIRYEADRLQYIVSFDEYARGLSAHELLSRVPMVTIAGGQPMILGKGQAHFMLNGRITDLGDAAIRQKLWTMRSEDIERIEVLSNPSGRDAMEMGGGYINIVLRRDQALGWRGDISTEAGIGDDWSGSANGSVSYASEKFDMTLDAHSRQTTQTKDDLTTYSIRKGQNYLSDNHTQKTDKELAANLTLRYQPLNQLEFGGMLAWQTLWPKTITNGLLNYPADHSTSISEQFPDDNTTAKSLTAYCDWHLDTKGKQMSFIYYNYKKDDDGRSEVTTEYNMAQASHTVTKWQHYHSQVDYHIQSARIDLTLPFSQTAIDVGASYTNIRNQASIEIESGSNTYSTQKTSSDPDYQERTKAGYLSLHHDWNRFTFKAGLRYEHISWEEDARDYWLPSASLSLKPLEGHHVGLSWATSCLRPNFYDLNPFRVYKTGYEYSEGNPKLKPNRMSNIELNYQNHHGLYACAYHHHGSHVVMRQTYVSTYQIQYKPLAETMPYNLGRTNQTGLYLRYQQHLSQHMMATVEGDGYYHEAKMYDHTSLYGWGCRLAASGDWYLNQRHSLLLNVRYHHWLADYRNMTKTDGYGYLTFALRYALLDDRLRLSLVANDPFRQHVTDETVYNSIIWNNNFTPYNPLSSSDVIGQRCHTIHHSHYIGLTAIYTFGGHKARHVRSDMKDTESKRAEKMTLSHY